MFKKKVAVVTIQANVGWKVSRDPRTGTYMGVCEALNLNAIGDTWEEFQECANEAIDLLFTDLFEDSEFDAFLRDRGWRTLGDLPSKGEKPRFEVPSSLEYTERFNGLIPARA